MTAGVSQSSHSLYSDRGALCFSSLVFQRCYLQSTKGTNKQGEKFNEAELQERLLDVRSKRMYYSPAGEFLLGSLPRNT